MTGLSDVVRALAARDGVEAVLLASAEGLPIDHAASHAFDPEPVAALAATLGQHATRLGSAAGRGAPTILVVEYQAGTVVLGRMAGGNWLAVQASPDADIGPLLHDLRTHGAALAALL
jgi:predicted regulator of Ras-like GTPase activity (Roadblock/LC7/MglB family)